MSGDSNLIIDENGVLGVTTDQIFTNALGDAGTNKDAGQLNTNGNHLTTSGGTLAFNDALYNVFYANSAAKLIYGSKLVFNGNLVDLEGDIALDDIADNPDVIQSNVDVSIDTSSTAVSGDKATINTSFGVSSINVAEGINEVEVNDIVTLVGGDNKELIAFAGEGDKSVTVSNTLNLGNVG